MTLPGRMCEKGGMTEQPFLIAGGGIAGLAASLGLARIGKAAAVYEQAHAFEEVGAGLQMSPNAVRALQWLGAWEAIAPACVEPTEIHVRDGQSGALLQRVRLGQDFERQFGAPYRVLHRADLLAGLLAAAKARPGIALNTGHKVTGAQRTSQGVNLTFHDQTLQDGCAVIAADGIRSAIRPRIFNDSYVIDQGHVLYRALIPIGRLPAALSPDLVTLWLLPGAHVVHYAVSKAQQFNIVVSVTDDWTGDGWSAPADGKALRKRLAHAAQPLGDLLAVPPEWLKWRGCDCDPRSVWSMGKIALIGDAAHATLPYLAQGAAMSLEDACVLAQSVAAHTDIPQAFQHYAQARSERTRRIQLQSREQGRIYHAEGPFRLARNTALRLMPQSAFLNRLRWIYDWRP